MLRYMKKKKFLSHAGWNTNIEVSIKLVILYEFILTQYF